MKSNRFTIPLLILILAFNFLDAQRLILEKEARDIAETFLEYNTKNGDTDYRISSYSYLSKGVDKESATAHLFQLIPSGFVVVSPYYTLQPVLAFSFHNDIALDDESVFSITSHLINKMIEADKITAVQQGSDANGQVEFRESMEYGPYINSLFGQVNCRDANGSIINVSNLFTPNHFAPGCVAISLVTMLDYYQWPKKGQGSHYNHDMWGSSQGSYFVDFTNSAYDWTNIKRKYHNQVSSDLEREALGKLVYDASVALDMDYEYNGSSSNVNRIPDTGVDYFRFTAKHASASSPIFWRAVDSSLVRKIPLIFAVGSSSSTIGHSVVCDGFRVEEGQSTFYHLNMGWWGSSNGWYRIRDNFNAGGYNSIESGIIQFYPTPQLIDSIEVLEDQKLVLRWENSTVLEAQAYELQYRIDDGAWSTIADNIKVLTHTFKPEENYARIYFRVRARYFNQWVNEGWSNSIEFATSKLHKPFFKSENDFQVFPNPSVNRFFILDQKGEKPKVYYSIYTLDGDCKSTKRPLINGFIDASDWEAGSYLLQINTGDSIFNKIIIKSN